MSPWLRASGLPVLAMALGTACGDDPCAESNVRIYDERDVERIQSCRTLVGLEAEQSAVTSIVLPDLMELSAITLLDNDLLTEVSLPQVPHLERYTVQLNRQLRTVDLGGLETVQYMNHDENERLDELSFPSLTTSTGELRVSLNPDLVTIDLPSWTTGELAIHQNPELVEITLGTPDAEANIDIFENASLPDCEALEYDDGAIDNLGDGCEG